MNILDARILLKRSTVAGTVPTIPASSTHTDGSWVNTDIYSGEAFLNTQDQRMFVRTGANIKEIPFQNYYVGQATGGGVVFHVYRGADNLEHGLIVSIVNQSTSSQWTDNTVITSGNSYWDGQSNTDTITSSGATSGAWKLCNDYSYGGFTDWYLPAIDELGILFSNKYNINKTLSTIAGANSLNTIPNITYWSSTEFTQYTAFFYNFNTSQIAGSTKTNTIFVRAIRQF